jgi:hypothetical protein
MAAQLTMVAASMVLAQLLALELRCDRMLSVDHNAGGSWRPARATQEIWPCFTRAIRLLSARLQITIGHPFEGSMLDSRSFRTHSISPASEY